MRPHLAHARGPGDTTPLPIRPETLAVVREGMRLVVAEGTGRRARLPGIEVCGKTGSAQVVAKARLEKSPGSRELMPHGWFLAFAPAERPRIALAVLVEHAGSGAEGAAPVARQILAHFFGLDRTVTPGPLGVPEPALTEAED